MKAFWILKSLFLLSFSKYFYILSRFWIFHRLDILVWWLLHIHQPNFVPHLENRPFHPGYQKTYLPFEIVQCRHWLVSFCHNLSKLFGIMKRLRCDWPTLILRRDEYLAHMEIFGTMPLEYLQVPMEWIESVCVLEFVAMICVPIKTNLQFHYTVTCQFTLFGTRKGFLL